MSTRSSSSSHYEKYPLWRRFFGFTPQPAQSHKDYGYHYPSYSSPSSASSDTSSTSSKSSSKRSSHRRTKKPTTVKVKVSQKLSPLQEYNQWLIRTAPTADDNPWHEAYTIYPSQYTQWQPRTTSLPRNYHVNQRSDTAVSSAQNQWLPRTVPLDDAWSRYAAASKKSEKKAGSKRQRAESASAKEGGYKKVVVRGEVKVRTEGKRKDKRTQVYVTRCCDACAAGKEYGYGGKVCYRDYEGAVGNYIPVAVSDLYRVRS